MQLELLQEVSEKVGRAIFITGAPRSGTSLMSNLIYSLKNVECFYEPPFLKGFLLLMGGLDPAHAKFIFESFLFHELFYQALAGRHLNLNENDESCVYHARSREEIAERLARSHSFRDLFPRTLEHRLAFKVPGAVQELGLLRQYYSEMTFLVMVRRPQDFIASVMGRGWCSDRQLEQPQGDYVFHRTPITAKKVPAWVPVEVVEEFLELSEIERCAEFFISQYRHLIGRTDCLVVDYDAFVRDPGTSFFRIAERLGESFGSLTSNLLRSVREPPQDRGASLEDIGIERRRQLTEI
jgi:hypothetical protein